MGYHEIADYLLLCPPGYRNRIILMHWCKEMYTMGYHEIADDKIYICANVLLYKSTIHDNAVIKTPSVVERNTVRSIDLKPIFVPFELLQ